MSYDKRIPLIDFGSTFTKVVYVDLSSNEIIAKAKHFSTVSTDITIGLKACFESISKSLGKEHLEISNALACSSAAGGLRIACIGFVPEYSMEAAHLAALGAGAKVVGCFSYEITRRELEQIENQYPDIILLTGGTDGGDKKVILHNAKMLASREWKDTTIIVAGNKSAADDLDEVFNACPFRVIFTNNVMPELGMLNVDPCNREVRDLFINNIIQAKGIGKAKALIKNVLMPTPSAVLEAARLLSEGHGHEKGMGELMIVDVGGATTDVHSIADGKPRDGVILHQAIPEPHVKRTVEGDLGLKYNVDTLVGLAKEKGFSQDIEKTAGRFHNQGFTPMEKEEVECHTLLSRLAVETAVGRHVGRIETRYTPMGEMSIQHGKDFTSIDCMIGTGGPILFAKDPLEIMKACLFQENAPHVLRPRRPAIYLDAEYILYAGGLLGQLDPEKALHFMKRYLLKLK